EDYLELSSLTLEMKFLGCRGTTGTEASFLKLFDNDEEKIDRMNKMIAADFGFESCYDLCAQTYPRKTDSRILAVLSSIGQSAYKMAQDIRLLQHDGEISEPFEIDQVGSSAMPYKKNPMRSERVCSLSRYLISLSVNPEFTAATQWLERSLDDSANRRIVMPEAFLCADAIVRLIQNIAQGLVVNERIIRRRVMDYLPFIETENLMMEAVRNGSDRQKVHEIIRICSLKASENISSGRDGNLIGMLAEHEEFGMSEAEMTELLEPEKYTGRSSHQVTAFLNKIEPLLKDVTTDKAEMEM
ncbi:MAG: adenylosuccinate lyase, partial [Erysipelotrichaceae bacterium]|nr:adenylosuccinate lyase [Erysipelotrichaceae bacterium]